MEKSSLPLFLTSLLSDSTFYNDSGKVEYRLDFSQRQWKSRVYLTFSLHFSPTRIFTTAVEKSSLPHFLTSLLSDSTLYNGIGKVESTALSHFTSLRLDSLQRHWKSRVYLFFSLHFSPTRLFTTTVEKSSIDSTFHNGSGKVESTSLFHFTSLRLDFSQRWWKSRVYLTFSLPFSPTRLFTTTVEKSSLPHFLTSLLSNSTFYNGSGKVEYRLDFSQRQWKSRVYLTFSLHFSPTRIFTTAVEKSSLPHFLTSLLSDSTLYNGIGKFESTSLSHFTSLRLDFSQRQWRSRVYLTFSLHFSPTRLFTTAVEKSSIDSTFYNGSENSSLPHFLTSLLSDSTFHNGSGKVESTSFSHSTSLRLDFLQRQWKSRVYLTFSLHFSQTRLFTTAVEKSSIDSTVHNGSGKVESTSLSNFTSLLFDFSQRQWKSRVYLTF